MTSFHRSERMKNLDVLKEVKRIQQEARELGLTSVDVCKKVGVKPTLVTSWGTRARADSAFRPRESVYDAINDELKRLRREKEDRAGLHRMREVGPKVEQVQPEFDEATPIQFPTTPLKLSATQALTNIIHDKIKGMTLVQLAMLIAHIEGNGK